MAEIPKGGWLNNLDGRVEIADPGIDPVGTSGEVPERTVMVYMLDKCGKGKEPIGILTARRKSERDGNNAIGMLRLARKEFAETEEMAKRIVIGDYV